MLAAEGVKAGDLVTIALPNGLEFYETTFALWKLGAVPNVVSHKLPVTEFSALLAVAQPKMVIGANLHDLAGYKGMRGGRWLDESLSAEELPEAISPHWKAMASGGSTGRPKIIVDHMPGLWDPKVTVFGQRPDDVLLNPGPLYHNAPFVGMHYGLFAGATVVEMGRFDAERALALVQERKVGWVNFVPTMMHRIWRLGSDVRARFDLASLHTVFHMAAPCPIWLKQAWIDWLGPERIFELYAGTERQGTTLISGTEWLERRGLRRQAAARLANSRSRRRRPGLPPRGRPAKSTSSRTQAEGRRTTISARPRRRSAIGSRWAISVISTKPAISIFRTGARILSSRAAPTSIRQRSKPHSQVIPKSIRPS